MALQIKEMHIRLSVSGEAGGDGSQSSPVAVPSSASKVDNAAVVQECVDQVLEILKQKMRP